MKRVVANPPAGANTISGVVPWLVAARVGAEGADAAGVLAAAGVGAQPPPRVDEHVDAARYVAAWRRATELVPDPAFPLRVAASFQLEDYEVFGFIAMSCATLGEAFDRTAAYRALFLAGARWELTVEPDATRLHWCPWPGDPRDAGYRAAMTFAVVDMANAIRRLARTGPHPAPHAERFVERSAHRVGERDEGVHPAATPAIGRRDDLHGAVHGERVDHVAPAEERAVGGALSRLDQVAFDREIRVREDGLPPVRELHRPLDERREEVRRLEREIEHPLRPKRRRLLDRPRTLAVLDGGPRGAADDQRRRDLDLHATRAHGEHQRDEARS
jgi:hypothetical protein